MSQQMKTNARGGDMDSVWCGVVVDQGYWEAAVHGKCRLGRKCGGRRAELLQGCGGAPLHRTAGYGSGRSVTVELDSHPESVSEQLGLEPAHFGLIRQFM